MKYTSRPHLCLLRHMFIGLKDMKLGNVNGLKTSLIGIIRISHLCMYLTAIIKLYFFFNFEQKTIS